MGRWALAALLQGTPAAIVSQTVSLGNLPEPFPTWTAAAANGGLDASRRALAGRPAARQGELGGTRGHKERGRPEGRPLPPQSTSRPTTERGDARG